MTQITQQKLRRIHLTLPKRTIVWPEVQRLILLMIGALLAAAGYVIFQVPHSLVAGGLSGVSIIVNHFTGLPVGLLYWCMNVPLLLFGFWELGRWRFLWRTLLAATIF